MRDLERAARALVQADQNSAEIERTLWLAKAADYAINTRAVLVGGAAVNLYTNAYTPTDVDMCARLNEDDRQAMRDVGFEHSHGDHFAYKFSDGQRWLLEFPDSVVDGETMTVKLNDVDAIDVLTLESLIVDRITQATDGTGVTFDEAVRLCVATYDEANWIWIETDIQERSQGRLGPRLLKARDRVLTEVRRHVGVDDDD